MSSPPQYSNGAREIYRKALKVTHPEEIKYILLVYSEGRPLSGRTFSNWRALSRCVNWLAAAALEMRFFQWKRVEIFPESTFAPLRDSSGVRVIQLDLHKGNITISIAPEPSIRES